MGKRSRSIGVLVAVGALMAGGLTAPPTAAAESAERSWNIVASPNTSPDEHNGLQGVAFVDDNDGWAVGFTSTCTEIDAVLVGVGICDLHKTLIQHWDGTAWRIVESPNPSPQDINLLRDVTCVDADDCWAVGNYTSVAQANTLILHWDGTAWNVVPSPTPAGPYPDGKLWGVTCVDADDCWAVGHGGNQVSDVNNALVLNWDGTTWSIVDNPLSDLLASDWSELRDVTCIAADDCWAVGHYLTEERRYRTLIMHWDGTQWRLVDSPNPSATGRPSGDKLRAVTCTSANACWAVGEASNGTLIVRWNGTSWSAVPSPVGGGVGGLKGLYGVTCVSADDCWAVGGWMTGLPMQILAWDGKTWRTVPSPGGRDVLRGVACSPGNCWAVGAYGGAFAAGDRASIDQTLVVGTIEVDYGPGEHTRPDPVGRESWVARYNGPANHVDAAAAAAVSPDGSRVFLTGASRGGDRREDFTTVAYDAAAGSVLWAARYNAPTGFGVSRPADVAVSPDGSRVFVTGESEALFGESHTGYDYATVAYDASDGRQLWTARYNGLAGGGDYANALEVSPDGSRVYVTGGSVGGDTGPYDYATVAYDAATGSQLWVARYNGPGDGGDSARGLGVSPDGSRVFVTGYSPGDGTDFDYATVAYDSATGTETWVARYNAPADDRDIGRALAVSPDGTRVFVSGDSQSGSGLSTRDYATVAYDTSDGSQLWVARYNGPGDHADLAQALGVSPDGSRVFVTGGSDVVDDLGDVTGRDYATVAYDAETGNQAWVARYDGPAGGIDVANDLGVSPDGSRVFVTGVSVGGDTGYDYATAAYDTADGSQLWAARHTGPGHTGYGPGRDEARALAVRARR